MEKMRQERLPRFDEAFDFTRWTNPDGVFSRSAANQRATNAAREISGGCLICTASSAVAAPEPAGDEIGDERTIDETREEDERRREIFPRRVATVAITTSASHLTTTLVTLQMKDDDLLVK